MSTVAKILVVVNLALAAAFVGSASTYLGNQDHWKKKWQTTKDQLEEELNTKQKVIDERTTERDVAISARRDADTKEAAASARAQQLELNNQKLRVAYDEKTHQMTKATEALSVMSDTLGANQSLINNLKDENQTQYQALAEVRSALNSAREQVDRLGLQLESETEKGKAFEGQIANLREDIERAGFEIQSWKDRFPNAGIVGPAQPAHSGKVLAADGENNVYVLSLGAEDGVEKGFRYVVSRGNQYVATINITDVQSKQSAARAIGALSKGKIRRGDTIMSAN